MLSVNKARQIISAQVQTFSSERLPLSQVYGRVLREKIVNDRDQPPFDKSTMDGILINADEYRAGIRFEVLGTIAAGSPSPVRKAIKSTCYKIMTGAVVAKGYNAVVPIEFVKMEGNSAIVSAGLGVSPGSNIRFQGSDSARGKILVGPGEILHPVHIACAASTGQSYLNVSRLAKIAIVSTGNELVPVDRKKIYPYQTRLSNAWGIDAIVRQGPLAKSKTFHVKDDPDSLYKKLKKVLSEFEILILSGGVSKGDFDYVPQILNRLGVECLFHGVSQKPGKPLWFGKSPKGRVVFALPGNPISTLVCMYVYVLPFLKQCAGSSPKKEFVTLDSETLSDSSLTRFLPVRFNKNPTEGEVVIQPTGGSGDFASLSSCDGFVEIPSGPLQRSKALRVSFYGW
ncbi:MAG: molybdopterin molybdotransferase MoeA [Candidatus Omnitrophica bacterium]|nr:molybdopterin molybdotransferase MoeA [Candidatus Omnitrophota bacterium]